MPEARFVVGEQEKHEIFIRGSFWWGSVTVDVDGKRVIECINIGFGKTVNFTFGDKERHEAMVKITATQSFELYVDGKFIGKA